MKEFLKKFNNLQNLVDAMSEESVILYLSKSAKMELPDFADMIKNNSFGLFKLFLNHNQASLLTSSLKNCITTNNMQLVDIYYNRIIQNIVDSLKDKPSLDTVVLFHLLGLLKYFKGYRDEYSKGLLIDVAQSDGINEICKVSAITSYLLLNGNVCDQHLYAEIGKFKSNIKSENFFYNYLVYYYGDYKSAFTRLNDYLNQKAPVLHMLYVLGDMADYGNISKSYFDKLEKTVSVAEIDPDMKFEILNLFSSKTE